VFLNSHLLMEVEQMCDRVVILDKGAILREGTLDELTPRTGGVRFELTTEAYDPARILDGVGSSLVQDGRFFELAANEDEVGEAIDRLRAAGVSIRAITPRKLTLEEAFIGLVGKEAERATPAQAGPEEVRA
jgi:ABC-2 type transport system ATP-binding protein